MLTLNPLFLATHNSFSIILNLVLSIAQQFHFGCSGIATKRNETIHVNQCRAVVANNLAGMAITHTRLQLPPETCHQHGALRAPQLPAKPIPIPREEGTRAKAGSLNQAEWKIISIDSWPDRRWQQQQRSPPKLCGGAAAASGSCKCLPLFSGSTIGIGLHAKRGGRLAFFFGVTIKGFGGQTRTWGTFYQSKNKYFIIFPKIFCVFWCLN